MSWTADVSTPDKLLTVEGNDIPAKRVGELSKHLAIEEYQCAQRLTLRTGGQPMVRCQVRKEQLRLGFAQVARVNPLTNQLTVKVEVIDDPGGVALLGRLGVVHGAAGGELVEQFRARTPR